MKPFKNFIASQTAKKTALTTGSKTGPMVKRIDGESRNRNSPKSTKNLVDISQKSKKYHVG